jgi:hypothetical protein
MRSSPSTRRDARRRAWSPEGEGAVSGASLVNSVEHAPPEGTREGVSVAMELQVQGDVVSSSAPWSYWRDETFPWLSTPRSTWNLGLIC